MNSTHNTIHIPKPELFSFSECLHFLDRGYDDCLYAIEDRRVMKALHLGGTPVLTEVSENVGSLVVKVHTDSPTDTILEKAADFVSEWFDVDRNLRPFYQLLDRHQRLAFMSERYAGLRLMGIPDLFEALCWCVIGQQINLSFAHRLKRRLVEKYGNTLVHQSRPYYLFPSPEQLANLTVDELKEMQFSRQKARYIIGIARSFASGEISKHSVAGLQDTSQMLSRLMRIHGVGEWTANYVLMKSLKQMECITHGDTGLQSAVSSLMELNRKPTREEVESVFTPFVGWESYLVIYLWRTLS